MGALVRYLDIVVVILAAQILFLVGAPALGYGIGAGTWVLVRLVGVAVDERAKWINHFSEEVALRLSYRLVRVGLLAGATVLALEAGGKADGLTALLVFVVAFTVRLPASAADAWSRGRAHRHAPQSLGS
jgi:hypothetical protein